jgi:hypothetical protein
MLADYIRDLRPAKWGSVISLHGSNCRSAACSLGASSLSCRTWSLHHSQLGYLDPSLGLGATKPHNYPAHQKQCNADRDWRTE